MERQKENGNSIIGKLKWIGNYKNGKLEKENGNSIITMES